MHSAPNRFGHAVTGIGCVLVLALALVAATQLQPLRQGPSHHLASPRPSAVITTTGPASSSYTTVVGLGDSVTAAAACECSSFVSQLGLELRARQGAPVAVVNAGMDGLTSGGLLAQVQRTGTRALPHTVTAITIGANDFDPGVLLHSACTAPALTCYQASLRSLATNVDGLLSALQTSTQNAGPVLLLGYWNVFLDGEVAAAQGPEYQRDSNALTKAVNSVLRSQAAAHSAIYVDLYEAFKSDGDDTPLLAADGDHPSAAGHTLIAAALSRALGLRHTGPRPTKP